MKSSDKKNKVDENQKYFSLPEIAKLKLSSEEKQKWLEIVKQIYLQETQCAALPASKCIDNTFTHLFLQRQEDGQIALKSRFCKKRVLQKNYLIRQFSDNKLNLSLLVKDDEFPIKDVTEQKIKDILLKSIKLNKTLGLYFYGNAGIGKTHKIISYCNDMIINNNRTISYIFLPKFVKELKENFNKDSFLNENLIKKCCDADILVLDDFGAEYTSSWFYLGVLLNILNERMENGRKIIVISNFTIENLEKVLVKTLTADLKSISSSNDNSMSKSIVDRLLDRIKELTCHTKCTYSCASRRRSLNEL